MDQNGVAFRSGTDSTAPAGELIQVFDELVESMTDFEVSKEDSENKKLTRDQVAEICTHYESDGTSKKYDGNVNEDEKE